MGLQDFTFYDLIRRNELVYHSAKAWYEVDDARTLTFTDVKSLVDRLACGLKAAGVQKGDRLGILGKNSLNYFLLYGAAAAVGAIVLPINWRLSADEVCFNLNDCSPILFFTDAEFQETIESRKKDLPSIERYFNLRSDAGRFESFDSLMNESGEFDPEDLSEDDGFVIIHTAAVGGRPRGALLSHRNVICADIHLNYYFNFGERDVHLNLLPLFHVGGLFMAFNAFHAGALNLNMSKFDAAVAVELIEKYKVTLFFDFPPILSAVMQAAEQEEKDISSLRAVVGLGTPDTIAAYQSKTGGTYYCMYGQTETSMLATMGRYDDRPGSAGKTIALADVCLLDEADRPVPSGEVGEIAVKGPMVFKGYWDLPEETRHVFRNGWHHTGDLGRFDSDGYLFYAGRKAEKELIKPGGENVYPAEVEKVILQHPDVEKVVVIGVPDPKWKEGIKAVCLLKEGAALDAAELIAFVARRIASYKKPHYVEFVTELASNPDGTPDRKKIKELYGRSE